MPEGGGIAPPAAAGADALRAENRRLTRRLARERDIRMQAEAIAERGLRDLYQKQRLLAFFEQIATLANQSGSTRGVLADALACVCRFAGWDAAHAYLPGNAAAGATLMPTNIWHVSGDLDLSALQSATAARPFRKDVGLPGRVWASGAPEWITDVRVSGKAFFRRDAALESGVYAAFGIPLLIEAEVVGVLEMFATTAMPEDAALLAVMAQAGAQLGRVIERERAQDRLHDSLHDALTGLPNRANFLWRLDQMRRDGPAADGAFTVLFVDLDHFKLVNDSLGHAAGDTLLREVGGRLAASLASLPHPGGPALLARLGGDEFTVLLGGTSDPAHAHEVAARLHLALAHPVAIGLGDVMTTASIGIAFGQSGAAGDTAAASVLRNADLAMYHAKARGAARTMVFDAGMHAAAVRRLCVEGQLREGLQRGQFVLHYQPIVRLADGGVVGFEALVRWRMPSGELRQPGDFIGVAEETGLIVRLGLWVLREACRTTRIWAQACPQRVLTMSVNLSARQFAQPDLVAQVEAVLAETGMDPTLLRLEITETATVDDAERAVAVMRALCALGIRISIDDFGTGFSSLSYLHRFPLHLLKIDRSFVSKMESSRESLQIVRTLLGLARSLGMEVVAEGAETAAEVERLRAMGCDYCQGFYFSKPLEAGAALEFLRK